MGKNIEDQPHFVLADKVWSGTAWNYPNLYVLTNETRTLRATIDRLTRERDAARAECAAWRKFWRAFKAEGYKFLSPIRSKAYAEANRAVYEAREASDALTPTTGGQGEGGKNEND